MDKKDKQILYYLDQNARMSYTQETVRYRVNNLIKQGIIDGFITIINQPKLGITPYQIMLKLQNTDEEKKKRIITYLKENKNIAWVGDLEGNFDIACIVAVENHLQLEKMITHLYDSFSPFIMRKTISINLTGEFLPRDYLLDKERKAGVAPKYQAQEEIVVLDEINKKLCHLLATNARLSSIELSKILKISPDSVIQRMKKLVKEKIILGSTITLHEEKIQQAHYKLLLYLNNHTEEKIKSLIRYAKMNNRVFAIMKTLAAWDYEFDIEVENIHQLKEFTTVLTKEFSSIIKDYDVLRIVSMPKFTFYP
ncbi:Lrp/AsnC family transcriptional regulator [Candidatus Woesearchaeota archaeon]|nr:Lrp/AsnC family transcriptional regulator [Candidatus Woesearchaeota archaeon]